jgi:SMC interacting uncharacterized protein involved in chromosome segregation
MTTHINELQQTIKEQEFSVDDIHKLESELKGLSKANDRAHAVRDEMRKMLPASVEVLVAVCNDLDHVTAGYNGKIAELQLVPDLGSKFAKMKAAVHKEALLEPNQSRILGVDLVGTVRQIAFASIDEYLKKNDEAKAQYQDFLDRMNRAEDAYKEGNAKFKIVDDKKSRCEQTLDSERKTLEDKLAAVRQNEVEAMEKNAYEEQMAAYERQYAELTALRIKNEKENIVRYKTVAGEVSSACQLMEDHHARIVAYWQTITEENGDIVAPTNTGDD